MASHDDKDRERDDADGGKIERGEPHADAVSGAHDSERHPNTPQTMQHDHEAAPGRQRYADARPGDYSRDFQEDSSGSHPVKPASEGAVDEDGIPDIAAREPHGRGKD